MERTVNLQALTFLLFYGCVPEQPSMERTSNLLPTTFSSNFTANNGDFVVDLPLPGSAVNFGIYNSEALDGRVAQILFPGNPILNPSDNVGPNQSTQLSTLRSFHYGEYRLRAKLNSCTSSSEGVVHGFFTYWNNGSDQNQNGMIDNSEIDVEILCGEPATAYLTIWTDYTDNTHFAKVTRRINLATGHYTETTPGQEINSGVLNTEGNLIDSQGRAVQLSGASLFNRWIEFQFDWTAASVQFSMTADGIRYDLWTYNNPAHIPSHPAPFMVNLWHNQYSWDATRALTNYPPQNRMVLLDRFSYTPIP